MQGRNVPEAHAMHEPALAADAYMPAGQYVHTAPFTYDPAGHEMVDTDTKHPNNTASQSGLVKWCITFYQAISYIPCEHTTRVSRSTPTLPLQQANSPPTQNALSYQQTAATTPELCLERS